MSKASNVIVGSMAAAAVISGTATLADRKEPASGKPLKVGRTAVGAMIATFGLLALATPFPEVASALSVLVLVSSLNNHGKGFVKIVDTLTGGVTLVPVTSETGSKPISAFGAVISSLGSQIANLANDAGGVLPEFDKRLKALMAAVPGISINNAYRPESQQTELWDNAVNKYGSADAAAKWVARPASRGGSGSNHTKGIAADLEFANDQVEAEAHARAAEFGLFFPMSYEPWHIELKR